MQPHDRRSRTAEAWTRPRHARITLVASVRGSRSRRPAHAIDARRVVGGLELARSRSPSARTDGSGTSRRTAATVRVFDPATDDDTLFVTVSGVERRGRARHARDRAASAVSGEAVRLRVRHALERRRAAQPGPALPRSRRERRRPGRGHLEPRERQPVPQRRHIAFGPDGKLYVIVGDGHHAFARAGSERHPREGPAAEAQRGVPSTNPFDDRRVGHRHPELLRVRRSTRQTGRLWETENGPACNDEVNLIQKGRQLRTGARTRRATGASPGNTNQDGPRPGAARGGVREPDR